MKKKKSSNLSYTAKMDNRYENDKLSPEKQLVFSPPNFTKE